MQECKYKIQKYLVWLMSFSENNWLYSLIHRVFVIKDSVYKEMDLQTYTLLMLVS